MSGNIEYLSRLEIDYSGKQRLKTNVYVQLTPDHAIRLRTRLVTTHYPASKTRSWAVAERLRDASCQWMFR